MDILHFWHCLVNAMKNHAFASLTSGSEHLLKYVTYVTWHKIELGNFLGRDDISENTIFHMFSY